MRTLNDESDLGDNLATGEVGILEIEGLVVPGELIVEAASLLVASEGVEGSFVSRAARFPEEVIFGCESSEGSASSACKRKFRCTDVGNVL